MAYGTIKVDNITFTNGGVDESITVSGLYSSTTADITVTGTVSGNVVIGGTTVSGATVSGGVGAFVTVSGATVSGGVGVFVSGVFASGTAAAPSVSIGTTDNGLYSPATNEVAISTSGTQRATIDSSGRLLVGTSSSTGNSFFQIEGNTTGNAGIVGLNTATASPGNGEAIGIISFDASDKTRTAGIFTFRDGGTWTNGTSTPTRLVFATTADGASTTTERMRIDSSGYVGIGTTSPASPLDVRQSATSGTDSDVLIARTASGGNVSFQCSDLSSGTPTWSIATGSSEPLAFKVSGSERARIDSSGRLLVGTSSADDNFYISGTAYTPSVQIKGTNPFGLSVTRTDGTSNISIARSDAVIADDTVGRLVFNANDGSKLLNVAEIKAQVDGTPGTDDMPGRLVFSTTADGASSPTEAMRINSSQQVLVGTTTTSTRAGNLTVQKHSTLRVDSSNYIHTVAKVGNNSTTSIDILNITVPNSNLFIYIEATYIGSRAYLNNNQGTSRVSKEYYSIARNVNNDLVLTDNIGSQDWEATTTSAGSTANKDTIGASIVRGGSEASTDPQIVDIRVNPRTISGASGLSGIVLAEFKIFVSSNNADNVIIS